MNKYLGNSFHAHWKMNMEKAGLPLVSRTEQEEDAWLVTGAWVMAWVIAGILVLREVMR